MKKVCSLLFFVLLFSTGWLHAQQINNPFFVFNVGISTNAPGDTLPDQIKLAKAAGFTALQTKGVDDLALALRQLDKERMELSAIYIHIDLDSSQPYDIRMEEAFTLLKGRQTLPWFYITSHKYPPSSPQADSIAIPILRRLSDMAATNGIRIMLYPHMTYWLQTVQDALRVIKWTNRNNIGLSFNLAHYLAYKELNPQSESYETLAGKCMPYLYALSINGADSVSRDRTNPWASFIKPLGEGNFDVYQFLKIFRDRGFKGPVGLQCYGIKEDPLTHLSRSVKTWHNFQKSFSNISLP
ncbi:sugar phosphate isomerase/epimerase family protein [Flavitalea flava]